jgi:hypothetical protein
MGTNLWFIIHMGPLESLNNPAGLYYLNIGKESLVNTEEDKKSKYTVNAYKCATLARELKRTIGRPST